MKKILVVDTNHIQGLITYTLLQRQYDVTTIEEVELALDKVRDGLDMLIIGEMPQANRNSLIDILKERQSKIPILIRSHTDFDPKSINYGGNISYLDLRRTGEAVKTLSYVRDLFSS
ncbi:hypothetical protein HYU23_03190 [Candidatus Woesearchaeota archaeon]|nr:hypothetical protein [Candidatus Woesearchaeota archaeon]